MIIFLFGLVQAQPVGILIQREQTQMIDQTTKQTTQKTNTHKQQRKVESLQQYLQ